MSFLLDQLLQLLFPRFCLWCKKSGLNKEFLCEICAQELPYYKGHQCQQCAFLLINSAAHYCGNCLAHPPAFDQTIALFHYQEPITHFIAQLKFNDQLVYGELMGQLLAKKINETSIELPECLIPVPLHRQRLKERGYNQALCITKTIAQVLSVPFDYQLAIRVKPTNPQSRLRAKARLTNLKNAFILKEAPHYQHIAIVDDVMTTGQTAHELAKCFKKAGVKRVELWCIARA